MRWVVREIEGERLANTFFRLGLKFKEEEEEEEARERPRPRPAEINFMDLNELPAGQKGDALKRKRPAVEFNFLGLEEEEEEEGPVGEKGEEREEETRPLIKRRRVKVNVSLMLDLAPD